MTSYLFLFACTALSGGTPANRQARLAQAVAAPAISLFCPGQIHVEPGLQSLSGGAR